MCSKSSLKTILRAILLWERINLLNLLESIWNKTKEAWDFGLAWLCGQTEKLYSRLIKNDPSNVLILDLITFFSDTWTFYLKHFDDKWIFFANCSMTSIKLSMFLSGSFFCYTVLPVIFRMLFCWHSILAVKAVVFFHVIFFWSFPFCRFLSRGDYLFTEALSDKALKAWAKKYLRRKSYKSHKKNWAMLLKSESLGSILQVDKQACYLNQLKNFIIY